MSVSEEREATQSIIVDYRECCFPGIMGTAHGSSGALFYRANEIIGEPRNHVGPWEHDK